MATYYSDAAREVALTPYGAGEVVCRSATYTTGSSTLAADSVIQMVPVPAGAVVLDIQFYSEANAACTYDIGDANDVDRYFDGLNPSSAAINKSLWADGAFAAVSNLTGFEGFLRYSADDTIDITVLGGVFAANTTVVMHVWYKMVDRVEDEDDNFAVQTSA